MGLGLVSAHKTGSYQRVDDLKAIDAYNAAGDKIRGRLGAVHWPDLALDNENLVQLSEGLLDSRLDLEAIAFGEDFDAEVNHEEIEQGWRNDELSARYAAEGVIVRVASTVRLKLVDPVSPQDEANFVETLYIEAEFCLSFIERRHTRPFVDFLSGHVRRIGDGVVTRIDAFACEISPGDALEWGLNRSDSENFGTLD